MVLFILKVLLDETLIKVLVFPSVFSKKINLKKGMNRIFPQVDLYHMPK